ncbi:site-specific integrase [Streptomyces macrosporus]|uniref:Site-specific integrase n=1 Tax=Streptomyces macrosporus TaxID=44032 RepID=A0ABP5XIY4_9ACTN
MPPRPKNNPRQIRSKTCGCAKCLEKYPTPERKRRRDCIGPWQARYRDPSGKQKAKNYPTRRDAEAFLDDVRSKVRSGTYLDPKRGEITLAQWWGLWWPAQDGKGRITTRNRKESAWRAHIEPKWATWKLRDIGYIDVQTWITSEVKGHHTQKKVLELLRAMMRDAVRDQRITVNPCLEVEVSPAPKRHPDELRPPTREQCALIREHLPSYYRPLVVFLEETGMRWGEVTGLRWCHVDLDAQHVKVKEVLSDDEGKLFRQPAPKTAAGFRTVPLTPEAVAAVETMVARWRPARTQSAIDSGMHEEELVFRGPQGGLLTRHNFRRSWIPAIQDAGVARKVVGENGREQWWPRVHDLRHTFATRLKDAGVPEKDVQAVMGHDRGSKVTWLYQHAGEDVAAEVLTALTTGRTLRAVS